MVSDVAGQVNVFVCVAVVLGLLVFRWRDAAHKPVMAWMTYLLMLGYAIIPLRWLYGTYTQSSWLVVVLNLVFCALIVWSRGNVSKIISLRR
ncbi:TPA: phage holin family protein [Escherichia coli]|uniref:Holin protein n=2 Tax=Escherichia coli TaxID=562 RepID=A0A2Y8KH67_ECOLX|nr:phage holin family protein [Escherichia coli]EFA4306444.1 phage holin family protein [Escherichia coli O19]EFA5331964.1 phage holin family protein [Escherichia coli]EFB1549192.1 phage holin family protein [Escherichia coli]EFB8895383.1 phage holin family protein [Escherichia coli]EFH6060519.1 phage holin family protein [Escherichia coli]